MAVDKNSAVEAQRIWHGSVYSIWNDAVMVPEFYCALPDASVIDLLIQCGSEVNATDHSRNTPMNICAENLKGLVDKQDIDKMELIIQLLFDGGAHSDSEPMRLSLQCLAARAIQKHGIGYEGKVPKSLCPFIHMH